MINDHLQLDLLTKIRILDYKYWLLSNLWAILIILVQSVTWLVLFLCCWSRDISWGCAIVNNSKITLPHKQLLKFLMTRNKSIKFDPRFFSNTFLFFHQENVRLNQRVINSRFFFLEITNNHILLLRCSFLWISLKLFWLRSLLQLAKSLN